MPKFDLKNWLVGFAGGLTGNPMQWKICSQISHVIPAGGTYYIGVTGTSRGDFAGATTTLTAGDSFPEAVLDGDVFVFNGYEYRYNMYSKSLGRWAAKAMDGWGVLASNVNAYSYGTILEYINNKPVKNLDFTLCNCKNLLTAPRLPSTAISFRQTLGNTSITEVPAIPVNAEDLNYMVAGCNSITSVDGLVIPDNVKNISYLFASCDGLVDVANIQLPSNVTSSTYLFENCSSLEKVTNLVIPSGWQWLFGTFYGCTNLKSVENLVIPETVENFYKTFKGCTNLSCTIKINSKTVNYVDDCFADTTQSIILVGNGSNMDVLERLQSTANNGNVTILEGGGGN